jgi:hypothetical protein
MGLLRATATLCPLYVLYCFLGPRRPSVDRPAGVVGWGTDGFTAGQDLRAQLQLCTGTESPRVMYLPREIILHWMPRNYRVLAYWPARKVAVVHTTA